VRNFQGYERVPRVEPAFRSPLTCASCGVLIEIAGPQMGFLGGSPHTARPFCSACLLTYRLPAEPPPADPADVFLHALIALAVAVIVATVVDALLS